MKHRITFEKFIAHLIRCVCDVFPNMHTDNKVYLCEQILKDLEGVGINKDEKKHLIKIILDLGYRDIILGFSTIVKRLGGE